MFWGPHLLDCARGDRRGWFLDRGLLTQAGQGSSSEIDPTPVTSPRSCLSSREARRSSFMSSSRFLPRRSETFEGLCQARPNALRDGAPPYLITPARRSRLRLHLFTITQPASPNPPRGLLPSQRPQRGGLNSCPPQTSPRSTPSDRAGCGSEARRRTQRALRCLLPDYSTARAHEACCTEGRGRHVSVSRSSSRSRSRGTPLVLWVGGLASAP